MYNTIRYFERPYSHKFYFSIYYSCFILLLVVVNLLLCLIYKLNFIIGMYVYVCIGKNIVHTGFGTIHSFSHGSLGMHPPWRRRDYLTVKTVMTLMKEIKEDTDEKIFYGWQNRRISIFENFHTTQSNLWIQRNPYQNSNGIFHKNRANNPKICMESQKTLHSQKILRKNRSWRH